MTIAELQKHFAENLSEYYPVAEIHSFFYLLSEKHLKKKRIDVALSKNEKVSTKVQTLFEEAIQQLKIYKPIQYITGETLFFDLPFQVSEAVLIPRPETEELVRYILSNAVRNKKLNILDIGTGSGCIAISLSKHLGKSTVFAMDVSANALQIAKKNAIKNNVEIHFIEADILIDDSHYWTNIFQNKKFDIIVSNPPYVLEKEKNLMQKNVVDYEPKAALFVPDNDPLLFYKKIAEFSIKHLRKGGILYLEINEAKGKETVLLLKDFGFHSIRLKKDIFGKDRMIQASKP